MLCPVNICRMQQDIWNSTDSSYAAIKSLFRFLTNLLATEEVIQQSKYIPNYEWKKKLVANQLRTVVLTSLQGMSENGK